MKKVLALILACLTLTACGTETPAETEPTAEPTSATTTTPPETEKAPETSEAEPESEIIPVADATVNQLSAVKKVVRLGGHTVYDDTLYREGAYVIPDNEEYYNDGVEPAESSICYNPDTFYKAVLRDSSRALRVKGVDDGSITDAVNAEKYRNFSYYKDSQAYDSTRYRIYPANAEMKLNGYSSVAKNIVVEDFKLSYGIYDDVTVNAFIRKQKGTDRFDVIIDPVYMYGIPVFSSEEADMTFDINGLTVVADTLMLDCYGSEKYGRMLKVDSYIYAELQLGVLRVGYSLTGGAKATASIDKLTPITDDVETVLTQPYTVGENDGKSPEMTAVYNAVMNRTDLLDKKTVIGIALLDLDFDKTPEVIISNLKLDENGMWKENGEVDADIYRIENGELKYIDTLYNSLHGLAVDLSNVLALKNSDGTEKWFTMSRLDRETGKDGATDYLFTLDGDKLNFEEIFRVEPNEDGSDYYYLGEKLTLTPSVIEERTWYEWNGYYSYSDNPREAFLSCKADFCEDMSESSFLLSSDWLAITDIYESTFTKLSVTKRELSYNVAYLIDAFYLGKYSPAKRYYAYAFNGDGAFKPVLYLYPEETTELSVKVEYQNGGLTCTYPKYNNGWNVTAQPDGTLFDENGDEYYCLYWEGLDATDYDDSKGFCVAGTDTAEFLREKLLYIGLSAREANEFIIYWLPVLEKNPYNRITFHTEDYANAVPLTISEQPDSLIRVFMTYSPLEEAINIPAQELPHYERNGFTVVEWGGGER